MGAMLILGAMGAGLLSAADEGALPQHYRLLYAQDFDTPQALKDFVARDPKVWKHVRIDGGGAIELAYDRKSYKDPNPPKHRSPVHIALIAQPTFTDFILDLEMRSTVAPYGHQDLCVFFGYQDPEHFYYSHIAVKTDDHAHNIFIVNDAPRTRISTSTTPGVEWKANHWHRVRLVRETRSGKIEVFFDELARPIMTANDKTFSEGWIGFGSFDDTGLFRRVRVYGPGPTKTTGQKNPFLKPILGD